MNKIHTISTSARLIVAATLVGILGIFVLNSATHAQAEDYSYTVGAGDGVTNLILDYADANDKDISPARAFKIAQDNGQKFLDADLTVESDLPYTDGIGAFDEAGVTIAAADNKGLFNSIDKAVNNSPDADADEVTVPADTTTNNDSDDQSDNDSKKTDDKKKSDKDDKTNDDEGVAADVNDGEDDENSVWPWIIGIAAVFGGLYYINQSREE